MSRVLGLEKSIHLLPSLCICTVVHLRIFLYGCDGAGGERHENDSSSVPPWLQLTTSPTQTVEVVQRAPWVNQRFLQDLVFQLTWTVPGMDVHMAHTRNRTADWTWEGLRLSQVDTETLFSRDVQLWHRNQVPDSHVRHSHDDLAARAGKHLGPRPGCGQPPTSDDK